MAGSMPHQDSHPSGSTTPWAPPDSSSMWEHQIQALLGYLHLGHQTETENYINQEINELRPKIENTKQEVTHDMENLRKKNDTEIQNKMEGHSSRIEQTEDRISEPEDEMAIEGKTELLVKQHKTCKKYMQELTDSIKTPNLRIMGIE
jgi:uncharacterized protein YjaZ